MTQPNIEEVLARRREREEEYGTWVATSPIDMTHLGEGEWVVGVGSRAFNVGDAVPKSTVERLHLDVLQLVARQDSAAADEAAVTPVAPAAGEAVLAAADAAAEAAPRKAATTSKAGGK